MVADFLDKKIFFREILEHKDEPKWYFLRMVIFLRSAQESQTIFKPF